jgi:hypothetical protein
MDNNKIPERIFRAVFSDGSKQEYTAEELGPELQKESRLVATLLIWDGWDYVNVIGKRDK